MRLSEIAEINPRLAKSIDADDLVSFVPMSAVDEQSSVVIDQEVRPYSDVSKGYTPFIDGDILVAKITPCFENGKVAVARLTRRYGFGSTEFHVVRPRDGVDPRYLVHFLRRERVRCEGKLRMTGSAGQRRVPEQFLAELTLPLPPLGEQQRIGEILDRADELLAKRRAAIARLDTLTQSVFLDMFGDPATNPKDWPVRRVAEYVAEFQGGKSMEPEAHDVITRNRVLKVSAVTGMQFVAAESKPVADSYSPPDEHFVRAGDLLFSRANTTELVGAVAYVREAPDNLLLPDKLWRFVWAESANIEPLFVWALFQTRALRDEIGRRATGTSGSMKNISQEKLMAIDTILPPPVAQREFARRVAIVETLKTSQRDSLSEFEALFASLQHRAYGGQL